MNKIRRIVNLIFPLHLLSFTAKNFYLPFLILSHNFSLYYSEFPPGIANCLLSLVHINARVFFTILTLIASCIRSPPAKTYYDDSGIGRILFQGEQLFVLCSFEEGSFIASKHHKLLPHVYFFVVLVTENTLFIFIFSNYSFHWINNRYPFK